jgi:hypothetical protein
VKKHQPVAFTPEDEKVLEQLAFRIDEKAELVKKENVRRIRSYTLFL